MPPQHYHPPAHNSKLDQWFRQFANLTADRVGAPSSFAFGVLLVIIWMLSGPFFHFSDTWQLVINTGTTIITFLMVFLIQNTQTRDTRTMHLKLDELIRSVEGARTRLVDLEHSSQERIEELDEEFTRIREAEGGEGAAREGAKS
jgi:low affinity Fe/Cu permease